MMTGASMSTWTSPRMRPARPSRSER
jgi:hypothetical protein